MKVWTNADALIEIAVIWIVLSLIGFLILAWLVRRWMRDVAQMMMIPIVTTLFISLVSNLNPLWIRIYKSSLWIENSYGFLSCKPVFLTDVKNLYIKRSRTFGKSSYPYYAIAIVGKDDSYCEVGYASQGLQLFAARDQLTQFLEARGVKVSNDSPPAKP